MDSQIILNADDFGRSAGINAAVLKAHQEGALTSASLMVGEEASDEAVAIAKSHPDLAVGLHIVVVGGHAVSRPQDVSHLAQARGRFGRSPVACGLRYAFDADARRELAVELRAQFERFAATGLPLAHVDGHANMHLHPVVFGMVVPLAVEFGARRVRVPRDDLWLSLRFDRTHLLQKTLYAAVYALLCRWCLRRLRGVPLAVTDRVYGLLQSGNMHEAYVVEALRRLTTPTAELYFHPALAPPFEVEGPNAGDLVTLLSPRLRRVIAERQLRSL